MAWRFRWLSCGLTSWPPLVQPLLSGNIYERADPSIPIDMASGSAPLAAQKRRRMPTQEDKGSLSQLLPYRNRSDSPSAKASRNQQSYIST